MILHDVNKIQIVHLAYFEALVDICFPYIDWTRLALSFFMLAWLNVLTWDWYQSPHLSLGKKANEHIPQNIWIFYKFQIHPKWLLSKCISKYIDFNEKCCSSFSVWERGWQGTVNSSVWSISPSTSFLLKLHPRPSSLSFFMWKLNTTDATEWKNEPYGTIAFKAFPLHCPSLFIFYPNKW